MLSGGEGDRALGKRLTHGPERGREWVALLGIFGAGVADEGLGVFGGKCAPAGEAIRAGRLNAEEEGRR
jgi:hypothetical protein